MPWERIIHPANDESTQLVGVAAFSSSFLELHLGAVNAALSRPAHQRVTPRWLIQYQIAMSPMMWHQIALVKISANLKHNRNPQEVVFRSEPIDLASVLFSKAG